jgi:hypothetical protein
MTVEELMESLKPTIKKNIDDSFNDALSITIEVVKSHYISGHSVVNPVLDSIVEILTKLKEVK